MSLSTALVSASTHELNWLCCLPRLLPYQITTAVVPCHHPVMPSANRHVQCQPAMNWFLNWISAVFTGNWAKTPGVSLKWKIIIIYDNNVFSLLIPSGREGGGGSQALALSGWIDVFNPNSEHHFPAAIKIWSDKWEDQVNMLTEKPNRGSDVWTQPTSVQLSTQNGAHLKPHFQCSLIRAQRTTLL